LKNEICENQVWQEAIFLNFGQNPHPVDFAEIPRAVFIQNK